MTRVAAPRQEGKVGSCRVEVKVCPDDWEHRVGTGLGPGATPWRRQDCEGLGPIRAFSSAWMAAPEGRHIGVPSKMACPALWAGQRPRRDR